MEQTRALMRLLEAAELLGMVEDLTLGGRESLTPAVRAGVRLTLKNVRETILGSHDALAAELMARVGMPPLASRDEATPAEAPSAAPPAAARAKEAPNFSRRDLRSAIEKFIEPDDKSS